MIKEALAYFSDDTGYRRLFSLFRKKYESLGRIGGTVKLDGFTQEEVASIARFFGLTAEELMRKGKLSLERFEEQLQATKFASIQLKELLEAYFNEPLISKKEKQQRKEREQQQFFEKLEHDFPALTFWFQHLRKKTADSYWIYRLMEESPESFRAMVKDLEGAYVQLPADFERLPMFSQRITRNPHAFDQNKNLGRLLLHLLAVAPSQHDTIVVLPTDSEAINDLLLSYKILRDDITNYVTCANFLAETEGELHPMWQAAANMHSVMNVPLRELIPLKKIYPASKHKEVWIVENSGVYSSILDKVPQAPLICTHGQFKLASLLLIDMLVKDGCQLHYAGDLDPEGVSIAERLLLRHPQHIQLWHMDVSAYEKSISTIKLSTERLKKLDSITTPSLIEVANRMKQREYASYQEALVDEMIRDLKRV